MVLVIKTTSCCLKFSKKPAKKGVFIFTPYSPYVAHTVIHCAFSSREGGIKSIPISFKLGTHIQYIVIYKWYSVPLDIWEGSLKKKYK